MFVTKISFRQESNRVVCQDGRGDEEGFDVNVDRYCFACEFVEAKVRDRFVKTSKLSG